MRRTCNQRFRRPLVDPVELRVQRAMCRRTFRLAQGRRANPDRQGGGGAEESGRDRASANVSKSLRPTPSLTVGVRPDGAARTRVLGFRAHVSATGDRAVSVRLPGLLLLTLSLCA